MKRKVFMLLLACVTTGSVQAGNKAKVLRKDKGSITFVVDKDLPAPEGKIRLFAGDVVASCILEEGQVPKDMRRIVATSFATDSLDLCVKDVFFRCVMQAYADHRPLVLSPDMVWLLISQGFSRYVNAHPEQMRQHLVAHEGKMDLVIETRQDLLTDTVDWGRLIDAFTAQIGRYTKADIAETLLADFSTTGPTERIASGITLMESVKSYFEYVVMRLACGIPHITLQGTVADWEQVLTKTRRLDMEGLGSWVRELEPILEQLVLTAKGQPDAAFWQQMVKKERPDRLEGGACIPGKPTEVDGWFLKLFPDENGQTLDKVKHTHKMPAEWARVGFRYKVISPADGTLISETPMELWAGFVGVKEEPGTKALIPQMGWIVREGEANQEMLDQLKKLAEPKDDNGYDGLGVDGIHIRVKEVPEVLRQLSHIRSLHLVFTDRVVLPAWLDAIQIDRLMIAPVPSEAEQAGIKARFSNAEFVSW